MPGDAITLGSLVGKLELLRIVCPRCSHCDEDMTMRRILLAATAALALTGGAAQTDSATPPSGQAANPTPTQNFTSALTGYSIYRQYLFGTGARGAAPIVPITNTTDLGTYFTPSNSYGQTKFNGNEWQRFVGTFADTKALQFTTNSIKLTAYIAGGLHDGGVNSQMLVQKQGYQVGVAGQPNGGHFIAGEMIAKIPNQPGAQPAFWGYQRKGGSGGANELDWMETPISSNGTWAVNTWVDGGGITSGGLISLLQGGSGVDDCPYGKPNTNNNKWTSHPPLYAWNWDGYKIGVGVDLSAGFHSYQFIWTTNVFFTYLDGVPMCAFNYKYTATQPLEQMTYLAFFGASIFGQPVTPSVGEFPMSLEIRKMTFWTAP